MVIWAADDEQLALEMLVESIEEIMQGAEIQCFSKPSKLLEYAEENTCDVVFLDINMYGISGVTLAEKLKEMLPNVNIIFVTGYDEYTKEAIKMHASGYILKPVTGERIREELEDLRYPIQKKEEPHLKIKCFGNFDVFGKNNELIHFDRSKAKEALAYLIYKSGTTCSIKELAAELFEDREYDKKQQGYMQKIISSMMRALKESACEDVILKNYNSLSIDKNRIDCDYYRFLEGDKEAFHSYAGEFMSQYPWAEFAVGYLEKLYWESQELNE